MLKTHIYKKNLTVIDAWGKIPSAVFDGNFFEFGGFSECFHIQRESELYKTQYCIGQLVIDIDGLSPMQHIQLHQRSTNNLNIPNIMQTSNETKIKPRIGVLL